MEMTDSMGRLIVAPDAMEEVIFFYTILCSRT